MLLSQAQAQKQINTIQENELQTGFRLDERESTHNMMQVTDAFWEPGQHLSFTAFATSYNSDPDMYISRSVWAYSPGEADYYCTRAGSDTCIIPADEIARGEYYYIVIVCQDACTYDLRSYYVTEYTLAQNEEVAYRWNGTSTNILKYSVPRTTASGAATGRWSIKVDPEFQFEQF
jgi:hypothetical protein